MKTDAENDTIRRIRAAKCCACDGPLTRLHSQCVNLVTLGYKATWDYPTSGNVLLGTSGEAVAFICDACIRSKQQIKFAVEYRGDDIAYHPIDTLERIEPC